MTIKGKDLLEQIKDKEFNQDILAELEKYEVKKPKSVWELKDDDEIWMTIYDYVKGGHVSMDALWHGWASQDYRRERGMVHLTKERAELHARVLNTELAIKKWKRENDNVELDWKNGNQSKYHYMYYYKNENIDTGLTFMAKLANTIYFSSQSKIQQCINDIGKERIIEWLKWEEIK